MMCPTRPEPPSSSEIAPLPPLTPETLDHARYGCQLAADPQVQAATRAALAELTQPQPPKPLGGRWRRRGLRSLMHLLFQVRVENAHLLPQTPAVFVANHLHPIDPLLLLGELPAVPDCYTLGDSRSLYGQPWKRRLLRWTKGVIPLNRWWKEERAVIEGAKQGRPDCLALAADIQQTVPDGRSLEMLRQLDRAIRGILSSGSSLLLFPEGRLGDREGQLLPLKPGTATYALRSGCPVVPIAIIGTRDLFFRKCLTLRVGEPIAVEPTPRPKSAQIRQLSDKIAARLSNLLDPNYREPSDRKCFHQLLNRLFA